MPLLCKPGTQKRNNASKGASTQYSRAIDSGMTKNARPPTIYMKQDSVVACTADHLTTAYRVCAGTHVTDDAENTENVPGLLHNI